ncbi:hypothetical protein BGW37DRAFT_146117 [Umbelopsis sp. PMI_123]|nr:hypothetical protein BGW37DRAFT_146117 [Umbelopsis sp. PMI_123]
MSDQQSLDTAFIATRYSEYKQNYFKIGREEVSTLSISAVWSEMSLNDRAVVVLCDLFTLYHQCNRNAALSSKFVKSCVRSIGNEAIINDLRSMLPTLVEWFIELDGGNEIASLEPLIRSFIYLPTRTTLLDSVLSYDEMVFIRIVDTLLQIASNGSSQLTFYISENLYALVQKYPSYALAVRFKLVQAQLLPDLALRLTITHIHDEVNFLNGELVELPSWILSQSTNIAPLITTMKNKLCELAREETSKETPAQLELAKIMRAIIGLLGFFGIKATEEQYRVCFDVIQKSKTERTTELSLCFILICAEQVLRLPVRERNALLKHVLESNVTEMAALIAVEFGANQVLQVEEMVREKLRMGIMIRKSSDFCIFYIINVEPLVTHFAWQQNYTCLKCKSFLKRLKSTYMPNSGKPNRDDYRLHISFKYVH